MNIFGLWAIQVDIDRAYDHISWTFVEMVLVGCGFHRKFMGWIMGCVREPSFLELLWKIWRGNFKDFFGGIMMILVADI